MAKDVDLSSKEWTDIIFEGKNKDFGAYELRKGSVKRHNRAMVAVVIIIIALAVLAFLVNTVIKQMEARPEDQIEQQMAMMATEQVEEEEEEPEQQRVEEEKPQEIPQEVLNTVKATEIAIVADEEVKDEIKSAEDLKKDETRIGTADVDTGTDDDRGAAQEIKAEVPVEKPEPKPEPKKEEIFKAVEQMPQFPGGDGALMSYISSHIRYPSAAAENGVQGRVVVQFVVTKTGSIGQVKVVRSKDPDLDREAVRVVKTLPKFVPGKMNGQAVNVWYTLPIQFKLQGV